MFPNFSLEERILAANIYKTLLEYVLECRKMELKMSIMNPSLWPDLNKFTKLMDKIMKGLQLDSDLFFHALRDESVWNHMDRQKKEVIVYWINDMINKCPDEPIIRTAGFIALRDFGELGGSDENGLYLR